MNRVFRLTFMLCLILSTSLASASVNPRTDDFEAEFDGTDWSTRATTITELLSTEYNHTADAGSSRSLLVQNLPDHESVWRFLDVGIPGNNAVLETWFYDDGATVTGFRVGLMETTIDTVVTTDSFTVGVSDLLENENTEYIVAYDELTTPTGIARSVGWHKLEFGMRVGMSITVRLDGTTVADVDGMTDFFPQHFLILSDPAYVDVDAPNRVWVDDARVYEGSPPQTNVDNWLSY